jgi:adenylate cyclase
VDDDDRRSRRSASRDARTEVDLTCMAPPDTTDPIRLLVVDDEPDMRTLFELRFRREIQDGTYRMRFAMSGEQALELVSGAPDIDVVITDLNMPGMDGLELLSRLEALELPMKTIVLTAYGDMSNIRSAMMRGAFDFQVKPLDLDDLRATIDNAATIVRRLRAGEVAVRRAETLEQRNRYLREVFGKYVNEDVVDQLLQSPTGPVLGGERRRLTVLMADIRGFTRLADELPADQVVTVLNNYLHVATEHILGHGGTINEILGDGLLVFFGAPIADPDAPSHAVAAAVDLQLAMADLNQRHRKAGLPELAVGIAIHTGDAIVGTVGSQSRMKYAAVGSTLNLVGRIEEQARGGQILISADTYRLVDELVSVTGHFPVRLKGLDEPVALYAVRGIAGDLERHLPSTGTTWREPLAGETAMTLRRVVENRVGEAVEAVLLAIGPGGARVRTPLMLAPLDEVTMTLAGRTMAGQVTECGVSDDGQWELTIAYRSGTGVARDAIERATGAPVL